MSENNVRITRAGQSIRDYLMGKRTRDDLEGGDSQTDNANSVVEPPAKKQKKIPKILDGIYYVIQKNDDGKIEAKCQDCGDIRKGSLSSTGNFKSHYSKKHPSAFKEMEEYLKRDEPDECVEKANITQPSLNDMLSKLNPIPEGKVTSKLVDFVVEGNLSFNVSQLPSLKSLLESVSGRRVSMPTRRSFMKELELKFTHMKTSLIEKISQQNYVCITCDVWSARGQSYLGATIHFINDEFNRESFLLAFKRLYERQTYLYLSQELIKIFNEYQIDIDKVTNVVTDGGSAFCKMFKEFGNVTDAVIQDSPEDEYDEDLPTDSGEHNLNITNSNDDELLDTVQPFMQTAEGEIFQNDILNFEHDDSLMQQDDYFGTNVSSNNQQLYKLPPQRRCFSHLLNLASQDFETNLPANAEKAFRQTYNKLHSLWNITNRSSMAKTICQNELGCLLKTPCETRWNSKFDSVQKVFEICNSGEILERNKINILIRRLKNQLKSASHLLTIEQADYIVIENYIKVMQPIACALDTLQGEFNCSQGYILPVIFSMKHRINSIEDNCNVVIDFKRAMLTVISKRFGHCMQFSAENRELILAAISHPKIKSDFVEDDDDFTYAKQLLIAECKKQSRPVTNNENVRNEEPQSLDFLMRFNSRRMNRTNSLEQEVESDVCAFLACQENDFKVLHRYPVIRSIFLKYNTTLSSSAAVERVFSQSMMIFTPRRNRISADHFEQTLLLKQNSKLISSNK